MERVQQQAWDRTLGSGENKGQRQGRKGPGQEPGELGGDSRAGARAALLCNVTLLGISHSKED